MNLKNMDQTELLELRNEITKLLPDIGSIDLSSELVGTYLDMKGILKDIMEDIEEYTPTQIASLTNSINSSLKQLTEAQKEMYNIQRQRAFENAIIGTFEHCDGEMKRIFLELLEEELDELR